MLVVMYSLLVKGTEICTFPSNVCQFSYCPTILNIQVLLAVQKTEFDHASALGEFMHTNIIYK